MARGRRGAQPTNRTLHPAPLRKPFLISPFRGGARGHECNTACIRLCYERERVQATQHFRVETIPSPLLLRFRRRTLSKGAGAGIWTTEDLSS